MASEQAILNVMGRALWDPHPTRTDLRARQLAAALGYPTSWRVVRTMEKQQDFSTTAAAAAAASSSSTVVESNKTDNANGNDKDISQAAAAAKVETADEPVVTNKNEDDKNKSDVMIMKDTTDETVQAEDTKKNLEATKNEQEENNETIKNDAKQPEATEATKIAESTTGNDVGDNKVADADAGAAVVDSSSGSNNNWQGGEMRVKKEAPESKEVEATQSSMEKSSAAIDNANKEGAPVGAASSSNPNKVQEVSTAAAAAVEKTTDEATTKMEPEETSMAMDIDNDDDKAATVTAAATDGISSNISNKDDDTDDKKDAMANPTAATMKHESRGNEDDDKKVAAAAAETTASSNLMAQETTAAATSQKTATPTKPTTFVIVDRIYAGKPGTECDMWFNHYAAMQAAQVWYEKDEQQAAAEHETNNVNMTTSTNTPFQFKGGHMLPRQAKFNTGDKVEVYMEDAWWDAKILRKKEHAEHGFRYQVHYAVDSSKQSGIDESLIRPRSAEKDPLAVAAQLGFPEAWQAVSTGHNRWKITSPAGVVYQSKKAALKAAKEEATTPTAADVGDPPWRTTGHALIGRTVLYSQEHAVSSRRKVTVEQIGKVVGWISETDVDKAGEPGFLSEQTGKPANLFHVTFEETSTQNHMYPGFLVESQDLEEFEVETFLIPEEDLQPAKKKARKR